MNTQDVTGTFLHELAHAAREAQKPIIAKQAAIWTKEIVRLAYEAAQRGEDTVTVAYKWTNSADFDREVMRQARHALEQRGLTAREDTFDRYMSVSWEHVEQKMQTPPPRDGF